MSKTDDNAIARLEVSIALALCGGSLLLAANDDNESTASMTTSLDFVTRPISTTIIPCLLSKRRW